MAQKTLKRPLISLVAPLLQPKEQNPHHQFNKKPEPTSIQTKKSILHTARKWVFGKSVERWEKTWSICLEASHHDAQKWMITASPLLVMLSSSAFDFTSFTDPPIFFVNSSPQPHTRRVLQRHTSPSLSFIYQ